MEVTILQEARRAPITFLYATERRFRSSTDNSWSSEATSFMFSTISAMNLVWYLHMLRMMLTLVTLGLLSKLGKVNGVFVTHDCDFERSGI